MPVRYTLLLCGLMLFAVNSRAQHSGMAIGAELDLPAGNSVNISPIGFGGGFKGELGLSDKFALTASASLLNFMGKKFYGPRSKATIYFPVKAGLKYYTDRNFYAEAQLGARFSDQASAKNGFVWSAGIGTFLKSRQKNQFDVGLRYEEWITSTLIIPNGTTYSKFDFFSLRAAYAFKL